MANRGRGIEGVRQYLHPKLEELRFRKRAGEIFTGQLAEEVLGWIGLNTATKRREIGEIEVNPVVGVRFQEVERIVAQLLGETFHGYVPPTISSPLGYIMPAGMYRAWVFGPGRANEAVAEEMACAVRDHALPFMISGTRLEELCRRLDAGLGLEHQVMYRRPVAWLLAGDVGKSKTILNRYLEELGDRKDAAAGQFRRFATSFQNRW